MTVNFYLHRDPKSTTDEKQIYCYVRHAGKLLTFKTDERISPSKWNDKLQQARISYIGSPELNTMLNSIKEEIKKAYRLLVAEKGKIDFDDVKQTVTNVFNDKIGNIDNSNKFHNVYNAFLQTRTVDISKGMIKNYKKLHNHIIEFEQFADFKVSFKNLDMIFFDMFRSFLVTEKKHTANTLSKDFDLLRAFLMWSVERGIFNDTIFLKFRTKTKDIDVIYLKQNELDDIISLDLSAKPYLDRIRDVFVFACYTGARFSDVSNLEHKDIQNGVWHLRVIKTTSIIDVPLLDVPIDILKKYKDDKKPLPIISSQKTNKYLKELCELANINEPITNVLYRGSQRVEETLPKYEFISLHTARRTFVTLSLKKGMRPEIIMQITGHSDYATFKRYIGFADEETNEELKTKWNKPQISLVKTV